jgi:hypothetical protein
MGTVSALYTHDIPTLMGLEEATVRGVVVIARARNGAPVFYYHRAGAGRVAHTCLIHLASPFNDCRLAKVFAEFWVRCDSTLGPAYLVKRLT